LFATVANGSNAREVDRREKPLATPRVNLAFADREQGGRLAGAK
jgi:hypothetical protein